MASNPQVHGLLREMLDSGKTPEEVCREYPNLLAEVRRRWQEFCYIDAHVGALLPGLRTSGAASPDAPAPSAAGLPQVPGYDVEAVLGHGGMGVVYRARQRALDRPVAVKMLLAGPFAGPQELERFRRETAALACLRHPNVVQVYDAGDVEGRPYFTMELVESGNLAQKLSGAPQSARQAAALVATLADAVQVAHDAGIMHRDLKPANILLTADGTPKISDFGLARRLDGGAGLTQTGVPMGTPSYMAPEQARGQAHAIGPAVDVYALGAILYELLTGRPPFRAESAAETVQQVIYQEPASPSRLNAKVPRDLETICLKCLHKAPARRYAGARDLAEDLGRFLAGQPIMARPVGVAERAVKWARRRPAVAALVVMTVAAAGTGLWLRQQALDHEAAQAQRQGQARDAIKTALGRADDLRRDERWQEAQLILTEAATHVGEAGSPPLEEQVEKAQSDLRIAAGLEHVRESSPLDTDGNTDYRKLATEYREAFDRVGLRTGDDADAVVAHIQGSAIRDQLLAAVDDRAFVASSVNDGALVERLLGIARSADPEPRWRDRFRDPAVWRSREQLLKLTDEALTTSPPPPGHQLALLGLLLKRVQAFGQSTRLLSEACRRLPNNFWLNRELGAALFTEDRARESVAYYRAALALRPDNAGGHTELGLALLHAGQTDEALAAYRRAVELSPASIPLHLCLMRALANVGYWKEAEAECRRAQELDATSSIPPLHLALVHWREQRFEDAVVLFRKALEINPNDLNALFYLGECYARMGRHEDALTAYRGVTERNPKHQVAHHRLARELVAVGRRPEAIIALRAATALGPAYPGLLQELGRLLRAEGQAEEAAKVFQKAATPDPRYLSSFDGQAARPRGTLSPIQGGDPALIAAVDGLAAALPDQGRFAEARAAVQRLLELDKTEAGRRTRRRQLDLCDTLLAVDARLPAILAGTDLPTEVSTQRALAEWCLKHKRLTATAASFYTAALLTQPSLADHLEAGHRFHAACAAALAGCGVGQDAAQLDDRQRPALRKQALDWLRAEHSAWAERHRRGQPGDRTAAATTLRSWKGNEALAGVRGEPALARLPADERRDWEALWVKVAAVAEADPAALFQRARDHVARGEWVKAAECYARGFELEPRDDGDLWFEHAAVQLLAGERTGYRRTCEQMLVRCQTVSRMRPYVAAHACTLAPGSTEDPAAPGRLSLEELQANRDAPWSLTESAALLVRAGHFERAVPLLEQSLAADGRPGRAVVSWLWLALGYHQAGQTEVARRWLGKAAAWLDQQGGRMPLETGLQGVHPHTWLEAHVLRKEAEGLLAPGD
jgi:serine/threonine-protein kinase